MSYSASISRSHLWPFPAYFTTGRQSSVQLVLAKLDELRDLYPPGRPGRSSASVSAQALRAVAGADADAVNVSGEG